jgi:CHAT domain-containing protein
VQRAFQVAGARTTVASLWQVDDQATRQLMERFYRNYWQRKMTKLDALREAQLWMLEHPSQGGITRGKIRPRKPPGDDRQRPAVRGRRTSPDYWAAFVLAGDWR